MDRDGLSDMRLAGRISLGLIGVLIGLPVLAAAALGGLFLILDLRQPPLEDALSLPGLSAPVEVVRDRHGIPHVFAATETDAYRALGYIHAQDRLAQMEAMRRIGAGRTAELVGGVGLSIDRTMRTFGLSRRAEAAYDGLPADIRAAVDAYTDGVNAWLTRRTMPLPVEFQLLWHTPEPWTTTDTMIFGQLISLLGGSWRRDLERAALLDRLGPDRVRDLYPDDPPGSPVTLAAGPDWTRFAAAVAGILPAAPASNWWAVDGRRTESGRPLLVNDPHLGIGNPNLFHLARIVTPDLTLAGAFAPGAPFLILGHNGHVAWGFTTPYSDTEDLFVETLDGPDRYLTEDGPVPFETSVETIQVRFGDPVQHRVRRTRHGPVLSDVNTDARAAAGDGKVIALASAALIGTDTNVVATWNLNRARTRADAMTALRDYAAPHQNIVLADREGIGFVSAGRIPVREGFDGRFPVPGHDGSARWTGFLPFEALPQDLDPPSGIVINANNRVAPPDYPHHIGTDFEEPWRAQRIAELLEGRRGLDVPEMEAMLADTLSPAALDLLPLLTRLSSETAEEAEVLNKLRGWNGRMEAHRPEPLIFDWWLMEMHRALLADELGDLYEPGLDARLVGHLVRTRPVWCDDVATQARTEGCEEMARIALTRTIAALKERIGPHTHYWTWGMEHRAQMGHLLLARVPVLSWWFGREVETDGGHYTVNRAGGGGRGGEMPFAHVHGAVFRGIYDFADLDRSLFVMPGGPSGDPFSPLFGTLTDEWAAGSHVPLAGDRDMVAADGIGVLRLRP